MFIISKLQNSFSQNYLGYKFNGTLVIKEQKKTYNNKKNGSKKQEQIIEEAQVHTNKIHPNTPFRKQQELKAPPKRKHPPQTAKRI